MIKKGKEELGTSSSHNYMIYFHIYFSQIICYVKYPMLCKVPKAARLNFSESRPLEF